jgi:hypothetical protein
MGVYWMNKCAQAVKNLDHETAKVFTKEIKYLHNIHFYFI